MPKYTSVNSKWPEGTNEGREIIPTPQEAISGAKRLYRKAFGKPFKGKVKLTSGRNYTYVRRHVLYVNPNQKTWQGNGGWHEIIHGISHHASQALWKENHGPNHATIERDLIEYTVSHGFLEGKLKSKVALPPDKKSIQLDRTLASINRWEAKLKRAQRALIKLHQKRKRYERTTA